MRKRAGNEVAAEQDYTGVGAATAVGLKSSLFGICDFAKEDTGRPKEQNTKGTPGDHCCPFDKSYCTGDSDKDARTRVLENLNFFARLRESRRACPEG